MGMCIADQPAVTRGLVPGMPARERVRAKSRASKQSQKDQETEEQETEEQETEEEAHEVPQDLKASHLEGEKREARQGAKRTSPPQKLTLTLVVA